MDVSTLTAVMFGSMIVLLLLGLPLAFVTGLIAVVFALGLFGEAGLQLVAKDLFDAMRVWAGKLPG